MQDLKSVQLDKSGQWSKMMFYNKQSKKMELGGVYIPLKFVVTTATDAKELKRFLYKMQPPVRMNFPISVGDRDGDDKKGYRAPDATFSIDAKTNADTMTDVKALEDKIRACLESESAFIRQKCDEMKNAHGRLVNPNAPKPEFHPVITTKPGRGGGNTVVDYHNFKCIVADDDYEDEFYVKTKAVRQTEGGKTKYIVVKDKDGKYARMTEDGKTPVPEAEKKFRQAVNFSLLAKDTFQNGNLRLKRDAQGQVLPGQGTPMTLQQVTEKICQKGVGNVERVLAVPTVQFSNLVYSFSNDPRMGGIRLRSYLRSCIFIEQPKFERQEQGFSFGGESFKNSDFMPKAAPEEPPAKRQRTDDVPIPTQTTSASLGQMEVDGMDV